MENASKALIIAGAVLIAILLISLSMYVFNKIISYSEVSAIQSYSAQAEAFNRFFVFSRNDLDNNNLNGIQIKGSEAYNIVAKVIDINNDEWSLDEIEIICNGNKVSTDMNESVFLNGTTAKTDDKRFTYSYTVNSVTGLINKIVLTEV